MKLLTKIKPFDQETGYLNVVIDTPKGCRNKYAFDFDVGGYVLTTVMPKGMLFPFDFGSIPRTVADDGDPLDVLVLMDEPAFCGCLVRCRLLGVIEATQKKKGEKAERNDRLIAVAAESHTHSKMKSVADLDGGLLKEIKDFFVSYNRVRNKEFKPLGTYGPQHAKRLIKKQRVR